MRYKVYLLTDRSSSVPPHLDFIADSVEHAFELATRFEYVSNLLNRYEPVTNFKVIIVDQQTKKTTFKSISIECKLVISSREDQTQDYTAYQILNDNLKIRPNIKATSSLHAAELVASNFDIKHPIQILKPDGNTEVVTVRSVYKASVSSGG